MGLGISTELTFRAGQTNTDITSDKSAKRLIFQQLWTQFPPNPEFSLRENSPG